MTPVEKAKELVEEIMKIECMQYWQSQLCALLMVEKIIEIAPDDKSIIGTKYLTIRDFYKQVYLEIENI